MLLDRRGGSSRAALTPANRNGVEVDACFFFCFFFFKHVRVGHDENLGSGISIGLFRA